MGAISANGEMSETDWYAPLNAASLDVTVPVLLTSLLLSILEPDRDLQ